MTDRPMSKLADELEGLLMGADHLGWTTENLRSLVTHLPEILAALRRVEKLEEALTAITKTTPATEGDGWDDGFNACLFEVEAIARQALTALNDKDEYR